MQKERLAEEFTAAVNAFQEIQRYELQKEREEVRRTRANSHIAPPPSSTDIFGGKFSSYYLAMLYLPCYVCYLVHTTLEAINLAIKNFHYKYRKTFFLSLTCNII